MWTDTLRRALTRAHADDLYRVRREVAERSGVRLVIEGRTLVSFSSNDYLGLANAPEVVEAWQVAASRHGVGATASHLLGGHHAEHEALEQELAMFVGRPRALLFGSGYLANLGLLQALADRSTRVYEDRLNHASLIDATRLVSASVQRYPHNDVAALEHLVSRDPHHGPRLFVTDGVFSMHGDRAKLAALTALAVRYDAPLIVDDAHGLGVDGATGRGSFEAQKVTPTDTHVLMGTLGKAFGVSGAFVAGAPEVIEALIQWARTYVYTTASPPPLAAALRAALRLVEAGHERRARLRARIAQFREGAVRLGLPVTDTDSPIQSLALKTPAAALSAARALWDAGFYVPAIRPPTVPPGQSRLRVTLSAAHDASDVERLLEACSRLDLLRDQLPKAPPSTRDTSFS